ncbi:MAG TPA: L,D-transpeptidase, partial [Chloroflexia bacterium]|nr:L,D-transpeptidase [Chloroflexia bacterium]
IYWRLVKEDMDGGGESPSSLYYNLKDVPWIQYFHTSGEGLHGTYWHDNFGRPMSHGCVNMSIQNADWMYHWASLGTRVEVHY